MYIVSVEKNVKPHFCTSLEIAKETSKNLSCRYQPGNINIEFVSSQVQYVFSHQRRTYPLQDSFILIPVDYSSEPMLFAFNKSEAKELLREIEKAKDFRAHPSFHKIHSLGDCLCVSRKQLEHIEEYLKKNILVS
jgi:hypothetical protein